MISTFNFWFIVLPFTLFGAIALAIFSVTEENGGVKRRGSDRLWSNVMLVYALATWITRQSLCR